MLKTVYTLAAVLLLTLAALPSRAAPRVAVFAQPGFPFYGVSAETSPRGIVAGLQRAGLAAELLDARALADPAKFSATSYAALVMPYGNTFPEEAFRNVQAFHRAGGSLILSGIPFTHPIGRLSAEGWAANPAWGDAARRVGDAHGGLGALELTAPPDDWAGVNSARRTAHPGASLVVSGWAKDVKGVAGDDWLYVRFYGDGGNFISQTGPAVTPGADWHAISAAVPTPAGAATWDVSPQIRSARRTVRLDDLSVSEDGRPVALGNAGFETPGADWVDRGHTDNAARFGPDGMGVGGFAGPNPRQVPVQIGPGDPLKLKSLARGWRWNKDLQWLNLATLPPTVTVFPALTAGGKPVAALVVHNDPLFRGAVDVWAQHGQGGDADAYNTEQMLLRGTVAALAARKLLSGGQSGLAFAQLDRLPRPTVYADLVLPTPKRPYPTFQPKMPPPARHLYVADLRRLSPAERLLLLSLQGLVNRAQPRIYLIQGADDPFWLAEMQRQGQTDAPIPVADPLTLVRTFQSSFKGAVIPDPNVYVTPAVAASVAGADDLVIATPELAARLQIPIKNDLRGKFADDAAALRYVRTTLWPRLNPWVSLCLDPNLLDTGAVDQIIAARGATFWITGPKAQGLPGANMSAEIAEVKAMLAQMPLYAVVRGFWWHGDGIGLEEGAGVSLGSRFGKVTVVSDYVANMSVFSGVPMPALKQRPVPAPPALDKGKVYLALTMSDGDNLAPWRGYFRRYFDDPLHGTFPVGWGMGPTLLDVAPTWARWYYERAGPNDEFLCDVSGVGYMYPPDFAANLKDRRGATRGFYDWTQTYMDRMDMKTLRLMNVDAPAIAQVGRDMPGVKFLMPDYGFQGEKTYPEFTYTLPTGQPAFRAIMYGPGPQSLADQIRSRVGAQRPAFINAFVWNWGSSLSDLKKMLDILGPDYVPVTPSQLNALYEQAQGH